MRPLHLLNVAIDSCIYINISEPRLLTQAVQWTYASRPYCIKTSGQRCAAFAVLSHRGYIESPVCLNHLYRVGRIIGYPNKSSDIYLSLFY